MFKFRWEVLTKDDAAAAEAWLNSAFKNVELPDYVGPISVSNLSFGDEAPLVQLLNISALSDKTAARLSLEDDWAGACDGDIEMAVRLQYSGNASFRVHSEMVINFPVPDFGRLPITLAVTDCLFTGTARLIKSRNTAYLTFDDESAEEEAGSGAGREGGGGGGGARRPPLGPLKSVRIESEIGDANQGTLRNAGLVEEFIVEQLQEIVRKKLVFPNMVGAPVVGM